MGTPWCDVFGSILRTALGNSLNDCMRSMWPREAELLCSIDIQQPFPKWAERPDRQLDFRSCPVPRKGGAPAFEFGGLHHVVFALRHSTLQWLDHRIRRRHTCTSQSSQPDSKRESGAIWMSGSGPAADPEGNIFILDANGTFDTTLDERGHPSHGNYGNSFVKITTTNDFSVADYFTMLNVDNENEHDTDLGSGRRPSVAGPPRCRWKCAASRGWWRKG